jgi:hypothetical protein
MALDDPVNFPLEKCEGIAGFFLDDISTEVIPKIKAKIRWCEDQSDF